MERDNSIIVYKVVHMDKGRERLTSCCTEGYYALEYRIGRVTRAQEQMLFYGYGILAFEGQDDAKEWLRWTLPENRNIVLRCWADLSDRMELPPMLPSVRYVTKPELRINYNDLSWPSGTIMFKQIEPIEWIL